MVVDPVTGVLHELVLDTTSLALLEINDIGAASTGERFTLPRGTSGGGPETAQAVTPTPEPATGCG